jgi:hypothetical protein
METQEYKTIKPEFFKSGFRFRQITREGQFAVFHKVGLKGPLHPATFDAGFEVVIISDNPAYVMGGVEIPAGEAFPSPEQWGHKGWTYTNLLAAEKKFEDLLGKTPATLVESEEPEVAAPIGETKPLAEMIIPVLKFTTKELANTNKIDYNEAATWIKQALGENKIEFLGEERRNVKGKPSKVFGAKTT